MAEAIAAVCLVALLAVNATHLLQLNDQLSGQLATQSDDLANQQSRISALEAVVNDLKERWYGSPTLWRPPPIARTTIRYFTITGSTQLDLINSLDNSDICKKYGPCATDPAAPQGYAWGLEGFDGTRYICYSPSTTTLVFPEHILLPRWSPPTDGTVKIPLIESWNALLKVIYTHEAGHVAITKRDLAALNNQAHHLASCSALIAFWNKPTVFNKLEADQNAYHARLRADCRPEIGCLPPGGWMGW